MEGLNPLAGTATLQPIPGPQGTRELCQQVRDRDPGPDPQHLHPLPGTHTNISPLYTSPAPTRPHNIGQLSFLPHFSSTRNLLSGHSAASSSHLHPILTFPTTHPPRQHHLRAPLQSPSIPDPVTASPHPVTCSGIPSQPPLSAG